MSGFILIEDRVLGAPASSILFNSGLTDYTWFRVTLLALKDGSNGALQVRLNGDSGTNYAYQGMIGSGSTASAQRSTGQTVYAPLSGTMPANGATLVTLEIAKPIATRSARLINSGSWANDLTCVQMVGQWGNVTDLISSITLLSGSGNFAAGTRVVLEGAPGTAPVTDSAVRLVVGGAIETDDYASATPWGADYETVSRGPIALTGLTAADVNDTDDFGWAISATVPDGAVAEVDAGPLEVSYDTSVAITPTEGDEFDRPNFADAWTATVGGVAITQASYRYQLLGPSPASTIAYDSGVVASSDQEHVIGSGTPVVPWVAPRNGASYTRRITVTEDGTADPDGTGPNISGVYQDTVTTDWTPPTAPTGLAAVAVTEEV